MNHDGPVNDHGDDHLPLPLAAVAASPVPTASAPAASAALALLLEDSRSAHTRRAYAADLADRVSRATFRPATADGRPVGGVVWLRFGF